MDILELESYEFAIKGRQFRLEEFTETELRVFVRKYDEMSRSVLLRFYKEELPDIQAAWDIVEQENHPFFQWLLSCATTEEITLDWVREHVREGRRRKIMAEVQRINFLEDRMGNLKRLLRAAGRITPGGESLIRFASATEPSPSPSETPSAPDKSSPGASSASEGTGSTSPTPTKSGNGEESIPTNPRSSRMNRRSATSKSAKTSSSSETT